MEKVDSHREQTFQLHYSMEPNIKEGTLVQEVNQRIIQVNSWTF